jgi:hypothetical protein
LTKLYCDAKEVREETRKIKIKIKRIKKKKKK